jgi:hypothetical protein
MRLIAFTFAIALATLHIAPAADVEVAGKNAKLPEFRPAVLGSGPDSLINRIDSADLLRKGQKDGAILFCSVVNAKGEATASWTYKGMPGTEALDSELGRKLDHVKYAPAIYNHQYVGVMLFGTLVFSASDNPHVHIFLNQDPKEFGVGSDFIGPQPVYGADSKFSGLHIEGVHLEVPVTGTVEMRLVVNDKGKLTAGAILGEDPPLLGFAQQAADDFEHASFIPAFRDGDPADCDTRIHICYKVVPTQ